MGNTFAGAWRRTGQVWRGRMGRLRLRVGPDVGGDRGWLVVSAGGDVVGLGHEVGLAGALAHAEAETHLAADLRRGQRHRVRGA